MRWVRLFFWVFPSYLSTAESKLWVLRCWCYSLNIDKLRWLLWEFIWKINRTSWENFTWTFNGIIIKNVVAILFYIDNFFSHCIICSCKRRKKIPYLGGRGGGGTSVETCIKKRVFMEFSNPLKFPFENNVQNHINREKYFRWNNAMPPPPPPLF